MSGMIHEEVVSKIGTYRSIYLYELIFLLGIISKSKIFFLLFLGKDFYVKLKRILSSNYILTTYHHVSQIERKMYTKSQISSTN